MIKIRNNRQNTDTPEKKALRDKNEQLSGKAVMLTALTVFYALLMLFLQNMSKSSQTVLGAQAFIQILFWGSIIGAMACAAWGAYKEKKSFFTYCGVFVYILWSMVVIQYCGIMGTDKAYMLVYISLAIIFVLIQVFSFLASRGSFKSRKVLAAFTVVSAVLFAGLCLAAAALRFRFFGLL